MVVTESSGGNGDENGNGCEHENGSWDSWKRDGVGDWNE